MKTSMKKQFGKVQVCKPTFKTAYIYIVGRFYAKLRGNSENFFVSGKFANLYLFKPPTVERSARHAFITAEIR